MVTINLNNINENKEYWYTYIEFSKSSRVRRRKKPIKVRLKYVIDTYYEKIIEIYNSEKGTVVDKIIKTINIKDINLTSISIYPLYYSKEEAINEWNRKIQIEKDKVLSEYERKIKYLNEKIL